MSLTMFNMGSYVHLVGMIYKQTKTENKHDVQKKKPKEDAIQPLQIHYGSSGPFLCEKIVFVINSFVEPLG